ncbi:MAG: hypothetical protein M3Y56_14010 [Armatimonadota bacterium]|nr:hypothetical protein [Armatimonadota bacterium]
MSRHILLDSSPLSVLSLPVRSAGVGAIREWSRSCLAAGHHIYVPEVIDYVLRRELLRAGKAASIGRLNALKTSFRYLPLTTAALLRAAELWVISRRHGVPTGYPKKLDIDVILSAQALTLPTPSSDVIIATANVGHLARFAAADLWMNIIP